MSETKIPVSTVAGVGEGLRTGDYGRVRRNIVDEVEPIRPGEVPHKSNSDILDMHPSGNEEAWAVKGLLHDLTVDLVRRLPEILEFEGEITSEKCVEILEGAVDGTGRRSPEIRNGLANLERNHGIEPQNLPGYEIQSYGEPVLTVGEAIEQVGEYAEKYFEKVESFGAVETEESIFGNGMSGRMDAVWRGESDRIVEIKTGSPSTYDRLQASAYWLMHGDDPEVLIEYPLEDERLVYKPDTEAEKQDFDVHKEAAEVNRYRDEALEYIRGLKSLQEQEIESMDSRKDATRKALEDLEVPR
jgi:hypothetical protein